jgi:predicted acylesterase/phospholipase RssA/MinD-like ATPase involved in chromosome partitioning or flagellar assembly/Flp pilus assembly protein TadD
VIYTFYSFKGGVGRSMALANLAEVFHDRGLRVVMIDWDLEAPGLETYFASSGSDSVLERARAGLGLMDLLLEYKAGFPRIASRRAAPALATVAAGTETQPSPGAQVAHVLEKLDKLPAFLRKNPFEADQPAGFDELLDELYTSGPSTSAPLDDLPPSMAKSPLRHYLRCVHPSDGRDNGLYLMSAGARAGDQFGSYASAVQEFDWGAFYAAYDGQSYFSWFRERLKEIADVVLIDSRTGVTEMGGVCTRHLADVVVAFCAPNDQNLEGVLRVISAINRPDIKEARHEREIDTVVVPARIDLQESDRLTAFSTRFAHDVERPDLVPERLKDSVRPFLDLQVPYISRYTYGEERVFGPDAPDGGEVGRTLLDAYNKIAVNLAVLAIAPSRILEVFAADIAARFPHLKRVPQMAPAIPQVWVERSFCVSTVKEALLQTKATTPIRLGIWGGPGSGKTSLLARVCRDQEITAAYPDGVLWLTADRMWTREAAQDWLKKVCGLNRTTGDRALRTLLGERRLLLVADDVWKIDSVREVLDYCTRATQVVISGDRHVASQFGGRLVSFDALQPAEAAVLFSEAPPELARPGDETFELASQMLRWPLGASLVRAAFNRRIAAGDSTSKAWESLRQAFRLHQILAFDTTGTDRNGSVARTFRETLSRSELSVEDKALLVALAQGRAPEASIERLRDLGFADESAGAPRIDPLVRAYLFAQGELTESLGARSRTYRVSSSEDQKGGRNADVERAKSILRGEGATLDEMQALAERLKDSRYFSLGRRLFALCRKQPEATRVGADRRLKLTQRHALCTYRDPDQPAATRYADALAILEDGDLNTPAPCQETLGLAGAICKYRWKLTGRRADLEQSLTYYMRGHEQGLEHDFGYTGINAAFVLDLLAAQEAGTRPVDANEHATAATHIREQIAAKLPDLPNERGQAFLRNEWWFYATLAEACFGLGRHDDARYWIREGLVLNVPDWQLESTTRQLAALAYAQDPTVSEEDEAWRTLRIMVGDAGEALRAIMFGKIGLALSGGGFRASLFHIGVLARLAELDLLRYVEVLSCVSGGSIIGAHFYLEVRRLLTQTPDRQITRDDYIAIVQTLAHDFLAGVQLNLRTRLFANWWANLRTLLVPGYTRTLHLGELFERHIFSCVADDEHGPRWLNALHVIPKDAARDFNPKLDNWRRATKVPILLLNATTLNTGHNWQFAVSWMGEPPIGTSSPVDRNNILRRMYYWEAPVRHRRVRLGHAVAASACVPALFDPVELTGLFPEHTVRLVDGGVHDNQGVGGLLEQECSVLIVSDASGQTNTATQPSGEISSVPLRANDILQARVREGEFRELEALNGAKALQGLVFLHLKKDLQVHNVDWVDCQDPYESVQERSSNQQLPLTSYGIQRTVQEALAGIRTDLDAFPDAEAYALMLSGYRMADYQCREAFEQWPAIPATQTRTAWPFLAIDEAATRVDGGSQPNTVLQHAALLRLLEVGAARGFKIWRLAPAWAFWSFTFIGVFVTESWLGWVSGNFGGSQSEALQGAWHRVVIPVAATCTLIGILVWIVHAVIGRRKSLTVIVTGLIMLTVGWAAAGVHLLFFDPLYLLAGAVDARAAARRVGRLGLLGTAALFLLVLTAFVAPGIATRPKARTPAQATLTAFVLAASLANAAQGRGDYAAAIPLWTQVLQGNPRDKDALAARGYAYSRQGNLDAAVADYTAALNLGKSAGLLRDRAYAYRQLDQLDLSRQDLEASLTLEPTHQQTIEDLRYLQYLQRPRGTDSRPPARLYVQIANPLQTVGLNTIRMGLSASVLVRPPQIVRAVPNQTELRYTHPEDQVEAETIAKKLASLGVEVGVVKQVAGAGRPRHFELWLARNADVGKGPKKPALVDKRPKK